MKILVVDDEKDIRELVTACLKNEGYEIEVASHGKKALEVFDDSIDLVLLDIMMPFMDGLTTCEELRKITTVPIVFLTARTQDVDQINALTVGADDYIKKPFVPSVLVAKIKAILRRNFDFNNATNKKSEDSIIIKNIRLDISAHQVFYNDEEISLTKTEFEILKLLIKNKGEVFSIERIYNEVWDEEYYEASANTVMVHIKKLRDKIEPTKGGSEYIKTVWGVGYKID